MRGRGRSPSRPPAQRAQTAGDNGFFVPLRGGCRAGGTPQKRRGEARRTPQAGARAAWAPPPGREGRGERRAKPLRPENGNPAAAPGGSLRSLRGAPVHPRGEPGRPCRLVPRRRCGGKRRGARPPRRGGGGRDTHTPGSTDASSGSPRAVTVPPGRPAPWRGSQNPPAGLLPAGRLCPGAAGGSRRPRLCPPRGTRGWSGRARVGQGGHAWEQAGRLRHQAREHWPPFLPASQVKLP